MTELAPLYGSLLPVTVEVGDVVVTGDAAAVAPGGEDRRQRLVAYCQEVFGFTPFDVDRAGTCPRPG